MIACPCCGSPVKAATPADITETAKLSPIEARILRILYEAAGPVTLPRLVMEIYGSEPPTGFHGASNNVHVRLHHLRKKLVGTGYQVVKAAGSRGYRLQLHGDLHG